MFFSCVALYFVLKIESVLVLLFLLVVVLIFSSNNVSVWWKKLFFLLLLFLTFQTSKPDRIEQMQSIGLAFLPYMLVSVLNMLKPKFSVWCKNCLQHRPTRIDYTSTYTGAWRKIERTMVMRWLVQWPLVFKFLGLVNRRPKKTLVWLVWWDNQRSVRTSRDMWWVLLES